MQDSNAAVESGDFHAINRRQEEPKWLNWAREKRKWLIGAAIALFILILGWSFWPAAQPVPVSSPSTFVVHQGDSLIGAYGFDDGVAVAERLRIPLRRRALGGELVPITYDQARALKSETDRNLVTANLYPGERITTMRFADGHVDFDKGFVFFVPAPNSPALADR